MSQRDRLLQNLNTVYDQVRAAIQDPASGAAPPGRPLTSFLLGPEHRQDQRQQQQVQQRVATDGLPTYSRRPGQHDARGQARRDAGHTRTHRYATGNGRVALDIYTSIATPVPSFVGGDENGREKVSGVVKIHVGEGDRIGVVRVKLKAIARSTVPNDVPDLSTVVHLSPTTIRTPTSTSEVLLLQLEKSIPPPPSDLTPSSPMWPVGDHRLGFSFALPENSKNGKRLPPSFLLEAGSKGRWRGTEEWASVKWYLKVTVQRLGWMSINDRIFAPFLYLPPPPSAVVNHMRKITASVRPPPSSASQHRPTQKLTGKSKKNGSDRDAATFDDPSTAGPSRSAPRASVSSSARALETEMDQSGLRWKPINMDLSDPSSEKGKGKGKAKSRGFFGFGAQAKAPDDEDWVLWIPDPPIFPMRATVPISLSLTGSGRMAASGAPSVLPHVMLMQRTTVMHVPNSKISSKMERCIATVGLALEQSSGERQGLKWTGRLQVPSNVGPSFYCPCVQVQYFITCQRDPTAPVHLQEPITLAYLPPPRRSRPASMTAPPRTRTRTPPPLPAVASSRPASQSQGLRPTAPPKKPPRSSATANGDSHSSSPSGGAPHRAHSSMVDTTSSSVAGPSRFVAPSPSENPGPSTPTPASSAAPAADGRPASAFLYAPTASPSLQQGFTGDMRLFSGPDSGPGVVPESESLRIQNPAIDPEEEAALQDAYGLPPSYWESERMEARAGDE